MTIELFNQIESLLWFGIAIALIINASLNKNVSTYKDIMFKSSITFIAFGISDLIEAQTGAWWKPWPLLLFKGLCLIFMAYFFTKYIGIKNSKT